LHYAYPFYRADGLFLKHAHIPLMWKNSFHWAGFV